jgi:cytochrome b561
VFGTSAYGGDFAVLPIVGGLALLGGYATLLGGAGAMLIVTACGPRPATGWAIALGVAWALLVMQTLVINVVVSFVQSAPTVYESMPSWGWWIAHAAYGAALGLTTVMVARRTTA